MLNKQHLIILSELVTAISRREAELHLDSLQENAVTNSDKIIRCPLNNYERQILQLKLLYKSL